VLISTVSFARAEYQIKATHPRLFIEDVKELAERCDGPLAGDYQVLKQRTTLSEQDGFSSSPISGLYPKTS